MPGERQAIRVRHAPVKQRKRVRRTRFSGLTQGVHCGSPIADCGRAPCLAVNHRFVGDVTPESFDTLVDGLRAGSLGDDIPRHGTLIRVRRQGGLRVDDVTISAEREAAAAKVAGGA